MSEADFLLFYYSTSYCAISPKQVNVIKKCCKTGRCNFRRNSEQGERLLAPGKKSWMGVPFLWRIPVSLLPWCKLITVFHNTRLQLIHWVNIKITITINAKFVAGLRISRFKVFALHLCALNFKYQTLIMYTHL